MHGIIIIHDTSTKPLGKLMKEYYAVETFLSILCHLSKALHIILLYECVLNHVDIREDGELLHCYWL